MIELLYHHHLIECDIPYRGILLLPFQRIR